MHVLYVVVLVASLFAIVTHYRAIQLVRYIPAARFEVVSKAIGTGIISILFCALYFIALSMIGVLPAFYPTLMIAYSVCSIAMGQQNLAYARQHEPAFA